MTLAAFALFSYGLGVGTLWDRDEPTYARIAVEILQTGDPFTLRFNGQPWFVHPPLFMWLQALVGSLFGFSEFTARIWSAVSGAVVVAETFLLARWLYDARTATAAAAILATTLQFLVQARLAVFDPTLLAFMLAAFYMALIGQVRGDRRAQHWAWLWAGLATATKGPIGLALPGLAIAALSIIHRDWTRWRASLVTGPLLFAAVGLPWYLIEAIRHGEAFLRPVVGTYLFGRFFGVVERQAGPWWYYAPVLLAGAFPWAAFLPPMAVYHERRRSQFASQVILVWVGLVLAFYTLAGTKLPNYILPVYPLLAIGIARVCLDALRGASADAPRLLRWAFALEVVGVAVLAAVVIAFGMVEYPGQVASLRAPLMVAAAVFAAGPVASLAAYLFGRPAAALVALGATLVVAVPVLVHHTLPAVQQQRALPRVAIALRGQMQASDLLAGVQMGVTPSLAFYAGRPVVWIQTREDLERIL
ncbi:MAG: glycosyltransferase family 39 protein, partial [Armatimonadetes bacterium]|nr:glycosyltransferase family 39 protein [Armatimonadota bacterium]